ncbi:GAF domain-containing protein [Olleya sp. 1-3]|uniref:GAF domain-containing protein n=1 Tax=Olleya sp. 1-3 TaxID=2058323 RepID=UPI000C330FDF|nr:GAF domain-containing protein [Olleya sp. 1-3]PKG49855.1 GAF domain-containing protein [Olleya sp. 1-3]
MIDLNDNINLPFSLQISFNKLIERYKPLAKSEDPFTAAKAKRILEIQEANPILKEGFSNISVLEKYKDEIQILLQDSFSEVLSLNEIKTVSVPYHNFIFNASKRFENIIKTAGPDFKLVIKNMPENDWYILGCTIIMSFCYGFDTNFKRPLYYEIPDENGMIRVYKITYNADFMEILPTDKAPKLTQSDFDELLDNFDNIELWKVKFPPNSYISNGFVISNMFDVTDDQAISNIKTTLIGNNKRKDESFMSDFQQVFRSLLGVSDLQVGFSIFNKEENTLMKVHDSAISSFLLKAKEQFKCENLFCHYSYDKILKEKTNFAISDVDKGFELSKGLVPQIKVLKEQGFKSAIFAPIAENGELLAVLELVSVTPRALNSINSNKLVDVMPFILSAVKRSKRDEENLIQAIIQRECTSIHPSVKWKFEKAARQFMQEDYSGVDNPTFNKISFENVYPLFGQIDVKGSSEARNNATQKDLALQLKMVEKIIKIALKEEHLPIFEQVLFQIKTYKTALKIDFKVDSEQKITQFFKYEIEPLFRFQLKNKPYLKEDIEDYFSKVNTDLEVIYYYRKNYDDTISLINKNMSSLLDRKQVEAQAMYPHFFERFKTDGVEHNMYIGESITKEDSFNELYLYNLRLWQMQVMIEMETAFYNKQHKYPIALDVASMILVFNQPLSIRFRADEKHFDVDGTYNARYEVVKKRVDKANIKGTTERITAKGKLTIVYSQQADEFEYLKYVKFLQSKHKLGDEVEILELEDLQGVTGLKAIRINMLYQKDSSKKEFYTYDDLMNEIKA